MTITSPERVTGLRNDEAALLRRLYRTMVIARRLDLEAIGLRLAGALDEHAPLRGREAAQIGCVAALDTGRDALFAPAGELGLAVATGADPIETLVGPAGAEDGDGTLAQAVGWALGAKLDRTSGVALAYLPQDPAGRSRPPERDRETMAVALRAALPVVFLRPSAASVDRGLGMAALRVEADDALAVYRATAAAIDRARHGLGPVAIETVSGGRDALALCEQRLRSTGTVGDDFFAEAASIAEELAQRVRDDVTGAARAVPA